MPPIPILLTIRELSLGGSERQLAETALWLDRSQFTPHVGCFRSRGIRTQQLAEAGIPVVEFPVRSFSRDSLTGARYMLAYMRQHNIRLVHSFDYPLNIFAAPVTRLFTRAIALTSQRSHRELTPGVFARLQRATDFLAHGIVVNCEYLSRHLREDYRIAPERIHLCYNGIDLEVFRDEGGRRRPPEASDASTVAGVVCGLRPEKDLGTLLEGFARATSTGSGLHLVMVGSGPELEPLQQRAAALGIARRVHWEPGTADVAPWLRGIDIFVLPSRSEAFSNSIMEAMACGCAVIASDVGGNPELVEAGVTGLLFPAGDAAALGRHIEALAADAALRRRLSAAARHKIRERFSAQAAARRMAEIYRQLLNAN